MTDLLEGLMRQIDSCWDMIGQAIDNVEEEQLHEEVDGFNYSKRVYHLIETVDYYLLHTPQNMDFGKYLRDRRKEAEDDETISITKDLLRDYARDLQNSVQEEMSSWSNSRILYQDDFEVFYSIHEKIVYTIRHTSYHLGELSRDLWIHNRNHMTWE